MVIARRHKELSFVEFREKQVDEFIHSKDTTTRFNCKFTVAFILTKQKRWQMKGKWIVFILS